MPNDQGNYNLAMLIGMSISGLVGTASQEALLLQVPDPNLQESTEANKPMVGPNRM